MKADTFLHAVGQIDDRFLNVEVPKRKIVRRKWTKGLAAVAAAAVLIVGTLPTLTAFGVDPAYNMLYEIAPDAAQTFKPVHRTCSDNGIEMTVISAERSGSEVSVYLAMHDTTGTCPDGDWDLFDSYEIRVPRDLTGHCSFAEYDADSHTAYFVVHLETMDGSAMPEGKVTFSVHELLLGKERVSGELTAFDMRSIPMDPKTVRRTKITGGGAYDHLPDPAAYRFLVPADEPLYTPMPGISVMGIGYVDGALHVLIQYEDVRHTDRHGFIELHDKNGNRVEEEQWIGFSYRDETGNAFCSEDIYPVEEEKLPECTLYGEFVSAQDYRAGNWQVTFPLE